MEAVPGTACARRAVAAAAAAAVGWLSGTSLAIAS